MDDRVEDETSERDGVHVVDREFESVNQSVERVDEIKSGERAA